MVWLPAHSSMVSAEFVKLAVASDESKDFEKALGEYTQALDWFMLAIKYEKNPRSKTAMTDRVCFMTPAPVSLMPISSHTMHHAPAMSYQKITACKPCSNLRRAVDLLQVASYMSRAEDIKALLKKGQQPAHHGTNGLGQQSRPPPKGGGGGGGGGVGGNDNDGENGKNEVHTVHCSSQLGKWAMLLTADQQLSSAERCREGQDAKCAWQCHSRGAAQRQGDQHWLPP